MDLGYTDYLFYYFKNNYNIKLKTKRKSKIIILYGIDKIKLYNFGIKMLNFKPLTSYKFRGIKFRFIKLKFKIGKKKIYF
jgi:ribosomal protein L6P/L9E